MIWYKIKYCCVDVTLELLSDQKPKTRVECDLMETLLS